MLDRTAFYPTSGGQPFDTGALGAFRVVDVVDEDDGTIVHVLGDDADRGPAPEPGQAVRGAIDWARRFDHMQQHTGQHVLSAAFDRLFGARTVSFHLGAGVVDDRSRPRVVAATRSPPPKPRPTASSGRTVRSRSASSSAEEAAALPLRKETARDGTLRLIDMDGFDLSACGGTHVASTGAIGVIAVGAVERFKGGQRVEFVCGGRARPSRFRSMRDTLGAARAPAVGAAARGARRDRAPPGGDARASTIADGARAGTRPLPRGGSRRECGSDGRPAEPVLAAVDKDADASRLKSLASSIVSRPGYVVVLVSTSRPAVVVAARSQDVSIAANQLTAALTGRFGGRGGGRPELAQAGGLDAPADAILEAARSLIVPST